MSLIDVVVPADKHISAKEEEKIIKYQDLRIELERLWKKKTTMIPIVIGALGRALGSISMQLKYYLELLDISTLNVYLLQKTTLLGTATTLRKVLQLLGCR